MSATLSRSHGEGADVTSSPTAEQNRQMLREAGVFSAAIFGGPGSGKTTLIDAAIGELMPAVRVGVIACDLFSHRDADRIARRSAQVVQVTTGDVGFIHPAHIRDALLRLDLKQLDLLLIENVGSLIGRTSFDLGQEACVALLSVAGGDDKADKHPDLVRAADAVVLNKVDQLNALPFDLSTFRQDVRRINPRAPLFEVSTLHGEGIDEWAAWLKQSLETFRQQGHAETPAPADGHASHWFG